MSPETKYFCVTEAIANYLQNSSFTANGRCLQAKRNSMICTPISINLKPPKNFLLPNSNLGNKDVVGYLEKNKIEFTDVLMYRTLSSDLSDLENVFYDVLVFFSPRGIESLYENFPRF